MANKGMIQVLGTTYRIVEKAPAHEVIRVLDDKQVGVFRHQPRIVVLQAEVPEELLLTIARAALRTALLTWSALRAPDRVVARRNVLEGVSRHGLAVFSDRQPCRAK